ncbi:GMC family oxidoreductase [Devosia rhodophyticola]|uniref:GMC family oxidoreductase n=1 Tax=Devosia rhodophyticola TaxID=3026423 RepID=A0ABY7Z0Z1_9HYPH|nr:GMC family oxidoreductase [Devosia rhodophyticola]WDR06958.1 GMC family oxidoreductase [Devosia rhodophyticola]
MSLDSGARHDLEQGLATLSSVFDPTTCDDATLDAQLAAVQDDPWFTRLAKWAAEAIYANPGNGGNPDAISWVEIGYEHGLPEGADGPVNATVGGHPKPDFSKRYDVIVVGAGAGGGVVASQLALGGRQVLLIERGQWLTYENSGNRDHLRNHRNPVYGHNTGPTPDDGTRVVVAQDGSEHQVAPHTVAYGNNAACVGSGTLIYGGQAWRFHPDDFRMASRYGVPTGSSLVDWPIGYADLEPWYSRAEHLIGVSGPTRRLPHEPFRSAALPMPPMPRYETASLLEAAAMKLRLATTQPPLLVNSVSHDGRRACIECGSCVGFACPVDGKNGTQNTLIPMAMATGNLHLATETVVDHVETSSVGHVTGVRLIWEDELGARQNISARADMVVLAAGAIESARLLLLSANEFELSGLGNNTDQVGRHLQGHTYSTAYGLFEQTVYARKGPGVTIATTDYVHDVQGVIGGAMLADDFVMLPIIFWDLALPPDMPRWGRAPHEFMRNHFRHVTQVKGPVHEVPSPDCRVALDPSIKDKWGRPVAKLSGIVHPETMRTADAILSKAKEWLNEAGALQVWGDVPPPRLSSYQHQAGTCRMGTHPENSVTDQHGRVWGHDNLYVADASVHPTNGAFNPVLTIMALALRCADHLLRQSR